MSTQEVPASLRAFAWNLGRRVGPTGRKQLALNVIERGRAWHWSRLPKGWFDLEFCLHHGQRRTRAALCSLFPGRPYEPSRHVPGLPVVALADLLFAKVSALSARGFPRDFIDLYAVGTERRIDWEKLLRTAARAPDNDYSPAEFAARISESIRAIREGSFLKELPVKRPPPPDELCGFAEVLARANSRVAQALLT